MAKNDVSVSNKFYKAVAKRAYMRESVKRKRQNKEFRERKYNAKHRKRSENIEAARHEKQTFHKGKVSNREHIRELNRKAQKNLREAMQSSSIGVGGTSTFFKMCSYRPTPYYFTFNGFHIFDLVFSVSYSWKSICFIFLRIYAVAR